MLADPQHSLDKGIDADERSSDALASTRTFCVPVEAGRNEFAKGDGQAHTASIVAVCADRHEACLAAPLMATQSSPTTSQKQEMLDALRTARDTVRVQAHLFSLEAKERWQELEGRLLNAEAKLEQSGDSVVEGISERVDDLVRAAKDIFRGIDEARDTSAHIAKVMTRDPMTCSPNDSLSRAAQIMWESDCGSVPVVNADGTHGPDN